MGGQSITARVYTHTGKSAIPVNLLHSFGVQEKVWTTQAEHANIKLMQILRYRRMVGRVTDVIIHISVTLAALEMRI